MSIEKRVTAGSIVGLVGLAINIVQSLLLVPLLLSFWTPQSYGLWMGIGALVSLLVALDTGHQNYLGNLLNRQWVEDQAALARTVRSGTRAAVAIALIELAAALGLAATGHVANFAGGPGWASDWSIAGALIVNMVFWVLNGSIGGIIVRLYTPAGLYARAQWFGIVYRLAGFLAVMVAVFGGASVLGAMIAQVLAWSACNIYIFSDLRRRFPEIHPWWQGGDWSLAWRNFRASIMLTINGVIEQAGGNGVVVFVGHALNPIAVALFTTLRTIANLALQGTSIMLNPLTPDFVRYHIGGEGEKLTALFRTSWIVGTTFVSAGLVLGVLVLEPLYDIWTRGALPLDRWLFAFLGAAVAVRQWAAPFQSYLSSLNRLRSQSSMAAARAIGSLGLATLLLPHMGLSAAGLGALVAEAAAAWIALSAVRRELNEIVTPFPTKSAILSLTQIGIAFVAWLLGASGTGGRIVWMLAALLSILGLACIQWSSLPVPLSDRLAAMLGRSRALAANGPRH